MRIDFDDDISSASAISSTRSSIWYSCFTSGTDSTISSWARKQNYLCGIKKLHDEVYWLWCDNLFEIYQTISTIFLMSKISLIIPAYNEQWYIADCIACALKNDFYEIIVVDNASTDNTAQIARDMWVTVIHESIKWTNAARQAGYLHATWDICAFVDSDTRMPDWRSRYILSEFKHDIVFLSWQYSYYDVSRFWDICWVAIVRCCIYPVYRIVWYAGIGWNMYIRRSTLQQMQWFDTSITFYGDDTDTAHRAHALGKTLILDRLLPTSARRLVWQWIRTTRYLYVTNFFAHMFGRKTINPEHKNFR